MKRALLFLFLLSSAIAYGQLGIDKDDLSSIPQLELPLLNNDKLVSKELEGRQTIGRAPEFARACKVDAGCHQSGQWTIDGDRAKWQMRIKSEGAKSLNFGFTDFYLPTSASFYMTGVTSGQRRGPFVSADNDPHDQFWSPIIEDEEVLLELEVDVAQKSFVRLHLAKVNHGFFKFGSKNFSGSCNLDVICNAADGFGINDNYRDIIRSVVLYSLNGTRACTGMLINNIREDGTPYIITADHCNISTTNASTLVAYYNFENSQCRPPNSAASGSFGDGSLAVFNSGAEWISATKVGPGTDFNIIKLDDPINPAADAFLSGWSREDIAPSSAIAIHHPNTDEKRISYENDLLEITDNGGSVVDPIAKYLRIIDWDTGTTEPGSSGSPLFNSENRFIGQLFGGNATCGNDESDYYGRLATSWEGGGTASTRAKDYLDPDKIELMVMDGIEASTTTHHSIPDSYYKEVCAPGNLVFNIETSSNFVGVVNYSLVDIPSGVAVDISPTTANAGEMVTVTISNTASATSGLYGIRINTQDGSDNNSQLPLWFEIQTDIPGIIATTSPPNNDEYQIPTPNLVWQKNNDATIFDIQIASDNTFNNIVGESTGLKTTQWVVPSSLDPNTTYFWRVRGETVCELGEWSTPSALTTGEVPGCNVFSSIDVPKTINIPTAGIITSDLVVSDPGRIAEVNVSKIKGNHTFISDLSFTLISPSGTEVLLLANNCGGEENFDIAFNDASSLTNPPCPYTDALIYRPVQNLSVFQGEFASGTWQLRVTDGADEDGGQLEEWSLEICTVQDPSIGVATSQDTLQSCASLNGTVVITPGSGFSGDVLLSIESSISGVTTTLDQTIITAGSSTNLNVSGTLTQNEMVSIRATDGTVVVNKNILLEFQPSPTAPTLSAPADMAMDLSSDVDLSWQSATNASEYRYQISTDSDFTNIAATNTITGTSAMVNLAAGTDYFWRVQSVNDCDTVSSDVRMFSVSGRFNVTTSDETVRTCQASVEYLFTLNSGVDGNVNAALNNAPTGSTVSYENNPGTIGQTIKVIVSNIPLTAQTYDMTLTLTDDTGSSDRALQIIVEEAPGLPTLMTPANNMADVDTMPSFEFDLATSATDHQLEVATDVEFTNVVIQSSDLTSGSVSPGVLLMSNTTYFWRVKATNSCGVSFSTIYQFLTKIRTSIDDVFEAESIDLVPNPARDIADIVIESASPIKGTYSLYGISGQLLKNGFINSARTSLNTFELSEGVYLVRIQDENAFIVKKLIILNTN